ncbi:hypothetical protein Vadar_021919 [Vaccinium darrowii]|uniref:Uncharacterized protein n=1 Tax=Vaccinium darrowii TaxID=229202 RepID=A0ACB7Y284_9ERIC|nr:hypothetical protein Vadar_021919 [Vaccinium darrowii]
MKCGCFSPDLGVINGRVLAELLSVPLPTVEHLLLLPLPPSTRVKLGSTIFYVMDLKPFKLDIDELINEFAENKMTNLADLKRILHI